MELPKTVLLSREQELEIGLLGTQGLLVCIDAPAGAETCIGKPLVGQTLSIDGVYRCLIPLRGLKASLQVTVTATLTSMTLTSSGPDTLFKPDLEGLASALAAKIKVAGTGDGALVTATPQTAVVATLTGEAWALYELTVGDAPGTAVITQAEYNGR